MTDIVNDNEIETKIQEMEKIIDEVFEKYIQDREKFFAIAKKLVKTKKGAIPKIVTPSFIIKFRWEKYINGNVWEMFFFPKDDDVVYFFPHTLQQAGSIDYYSSDRYLTFGQIKNFVFEFPKIIEYISKLSSDLAKELSSLAPILD